MKTRILLALPLAAALMLPAGAQQQSTTSPSDQNQPATSTQGTTEAQSPQQGQPAQQGQTATTQDQNLSARQPLAMEQHEGFWGKINPFARKKYVQRNLEPVRNRVNELDELTSANTKMIRDVDARAQEGIRLAHTKATEADQHAIDAGNRAQMAHQTAQQASTRLTTVEQVVTNLDQYQPVNQTEIRFRAGQVGLSKKAKSALDEIATTVKGQKGYVIEVQGFSPGSGHEAIESSRNMAQSVVRYLVLNHEVPVYRIFTVGMGNAPLPARADGTKARRTRGGRVEISLLKNNLEQLHAEAAPSTTTGTQGGFSGTATDQQYAPPSQPGQPQAQPQQSQPQSQTQQPATNLNASPSTTTPTTSESPAQPSPNETPQQAPPRM